MPLYEYVCPACEITFDKLRPIGSADNVECPSCRKPARRKVSTFICRSRDEGGTITRIEDTGSGSPGGSCGSCHSGSCATCGH